ncbi:MAG: glycosyltransferase family 39 protein [Candidatus Micrarchaeota archaeon]|nr:glycosyltransferase family 39 protein [Candidatus Micrarchaeota archaeon]MDE1849318.1 glycosyltransferase family 39 protein [Candidatus Micrarchaeota archaeon]
MFYILGNLLVLGYTAALLGLLAFVYLSRRRIYDALRGRVDRYSLAVLIGTLAFFLMVSILLVHPAEQLYFDENIYQGIAINILKHFDATWCQYGTGMVSSCGSTLIYHDPAEFSFFIAIAFALFGIGTATSFATTLFFGFLAVLFVFLLSSALFGKRIGPIATALFAIMPELYIWSRVQASPDLGFMALTTLSMLLFAVYIRNRSRASLLAFLFSLALSVGMRTEGILLIPLFIIAYLLSFEGSLRRKLKSFYGSAMSASNDTGTLLCLLAFFLVISPQIFFIAYQLPNPQFGQDAQHHLFSIQNLMHNGRDNLLYLSGYYDQQSYYPASFPLSFSVMALIGIITLILDRGIRGKGISSALLFMWILFYELFYDFFYAGSAVYGVDARFMLQLHPAIAILAGVGLYGIISAIYGLVQGKLRNKNALKRSVIFTAIYSFVTVTFLCLSISQYLGIITIAPQNMPQQNVIYPAMSFFYGNYSHVPNNCLVFSFTPDIWLEVNRSAAQIGYIYGGDSNFTDFSRRYSCYVFDYGYWCTVPPNHGGMCSQILKSYATRSIVSGSIPSSEATNVSLYYILNYSH